MSKEKREFDKEAASWDENPGRVKLANDIARAISRQITLTPDMSVMDFGCGTGLLTIHLQPLVRSIIGVDSSQGMLDILKTKIAKMNLNNVKAELVDLDRGDILTGSYNLVLSNMTLHHIKDIKHLFDQFHKITALPGYLCIADLDSDEGRFHDDNTGVFHFGFARPELRRIFKEAGFDNVQDLTAAEVMKPSSDGEMKCFTVFLMTGRKGSDKE